MNYTSHLNLKKPAYTDPADIVDINDNMDTIDARIEDIEDGTIVVMKSTEAASAVKLKTARNINGVAFDGSANITLYDNTKAPINHRSTGTGYGLGSHDYFGHVKTINNLTTSYYQEGLALNAYQGKVLDEKIARSKITETVLLTSLAFDGSTALDISNYITDNYDEYIISLSGNITVTGVSDSYNDFAIGIDESDLYRTDLESVFVKGVANNGYTATFSNISVFKVFTRSHYYDYPSTSTKYTSYANIDSLNTNTSIDTDETLFFRVYTEYEGRPVITASCTLKIYGRNYSF